MLQFERQVGRNIGVRLTGAHSRALNQARLANVLRPYDVYTIPITNSIPAPSGALEPGNPYGTLTYWDYPAAYAGVAFQRPMIVNDPKANQKYSSFEAALSRRLADRWQFMGSYSVTRISQPLPINVGGGVTAGFNTQDPNAEINVAIDGWEWQVRGSGSYALRAQVTLSANYELRSGAYWARDHQFRGGVRIPSIVLKVEPATAHRRDNINLLDFRIEKGFSLSSRSSIRAAVEVYNTMNTNTVLGTTVRTGPNFGRITSIMLPRIVVLRATYHF
jgi:hypothetical protein